MLYKGSCHCGNVAFEVEGEIDRVYDCNCSICQRMGSLHWFLPRDRMRLLTPEDKLATYTFSPHTIKHHFCPTCGIHPFGEGTDPKGNAKVAVNARCLEGLDLDGLKVEKIDGRSR
jgi:hypothetical protein